MIFLLLSVLLIILKRNGLFLLLAYINISEKKSLFIYGSVSGNITGDLVPHRICLDICEQSYLLFIMLVVISELVREPFHKLDSDAFYIRRSNITHIDT